MYSSILPLTRISSFKLPREPLPHPSLPSRVGLCDCAQVSRLPRREGGAEGG
jgi:hypothetical protein